MATETIDLAPTSDEYANIGAAFIVDLVYSKVKHAEQERAAAILESLLDLARYLAVIDSKMGTAHVRAMLERGGLKPYPQEGGR